MIFCRWYEKVFCRNKSVKKEVAILLFIKLIEEVQQFFSCIFSFDLFGQVFVDICPFLNLLWSCFPYKIEQFFLWMINTYSIEDFSEFEDSKFVNNHFKSLVFWKVIFLYVSDPFCLTNYRHTCYQFSILKLVIELLALEERLIEIFLIMSILKEICFALFWKGLLNNERVCVATLSHVLDH